MTKKKAAPKPRKKPENHDSTAETEGHAPGPASKPISLNGLTAEEALKLAMSVPPPPGGWPR